MPAAAASVPMGTLSISLIADLTKYSKNMTYAIKRLGDFTKKANEMSKKFTIAFKGLGGDVTKSISEMTGAVKKAGMDVTRLTDKLGQLNKKVRTGGQAFRDEANDVGETMTRRGKQGLGAILSFSEGIKRFISLNVRWFVIWRSFWAVWGALQKAATEFKDLMNETALALRTATTSLGSWVEKQIIGLQIRRDAIAATMQHAITNRDYIKSLYYLTTAGIKYSKAQKFVNISIKTAIALDEEHETTVRLLTGLYNVFGETMVGVGSELGKFQKLSAMLTATFREQDIELADYAKSLPYVATQWKLSGNAIEPLIAALGVMGTHFLRGSKSATSLNRTLGMLMKYPERFAKLTGVAFDPKKPLDYIAVIGKMQEVLGEGEEGLLRVGFSVKELNDLYTLMGIRGGRAAALLIDKFEEWEIQIRKNVNATYELTETMAALAEMTVPKQLEIMNNILRGWIANFLLAAASTTDFASALYKVNEALRMITPIFTTLGTLISPFVSSLTRLITTITLLGMAWKSKGIFRAIPDELIVARREMQLSGRRMVKSIKTFGRQSRKELRLSSRHIVGDIRIFGRRAGRALQLSGQRMVNSIKISGMRAVNAGRKAASKAVGAIRDSFIPRFLAMTAIISGAIGMMSAIWEVGQGKFVESSKKAALQRELTEKTSMQKIIGWVKAFFNSQDLAHRMHNGKYLKRYREFMAMKKRMLDEAVREEWMTQEEADRDLLISQQNWWKHLLGEQLDYNSRAALARDANLENVFEKFEQQSKFLKESWPKLLDELMKIRLSAMQYELYQLDKQYSEGYEKAAGNKGNIAKLDEWYREVRLSKLKKYGKDITEETRKQLSTIEEMEKEGLERKIHRIRKSTDDALEDQRKAGTNRIELILSQSKKERAVRLEAIEKIRGDAEKDFAIEDKNLDSALGILSSYLTEEQKQNRFNERDKSKTRLEETEKRVQIAEDEIIAIEEMTKAVSDIQVRYRSGDISAMTAYRDTLSAIQGNRDQKLIQAVRETQELLRRRSAAGRKAEQDEIDKDNKKIADKDAKAADKREKAYEKMLSNLELAEATDFEKKVLRLGKERVKREQIVKDFFGNTWNITKEELDAIDRIHKEYADELAKLYKYEPLRKRLTEFQEFAKSTWESIGTSIKDSMGDAMFEMIKATGDFRDKMGQIWQSLIDSVLRQLARLAAENIAGQIWGAMKGVTGGEVQVTGRAALGQAVSVIGGMGQIAPSKIPSIEKKAAPKIEGGIQSLLQGIIPGMGAGAVQGAGIVPVVNVEINNFVDPSMFAAAIAQNPDAITNIITQDALNKGSVLSVLTSMLPRG